MRHTATLIALFALLTLSFAADKPADKEEGHDATSKTWFRNIRVKVLPE